VCGRGAAAGIDERQPLDQVLVDRRRSWLYNKDILWAHRVEQLHCDFAIGVAHDVHPPRHTPSLCATSPAKMGLAVPEKSPKGSISHTFSAIPSRLRYVTQVAGVRLREAGNGFDAGG
jgi:hypothetical protein